MFYLEKNYILSSPSFCTDIKLSIFENEENNRCQRLQRSFSEELGRTNWDSSHKVQKCVDYLK